MRFSFANFMRGFGAAKPLLAMSGLFLLLALIETLWLHGLQSQENQFSDWMMRRQALEKAPDPEIVLVNIDDASLARLQNVAGSWPWPRAVHGELVQGLSKQQPKAIVFDINFEQPDVCRPESDQLFNQALQGTRNVYFPLGAPSGGAGCCRPAGAADRQPGRLDPHGRSRSERAHCFVRAAGDRAALLAHRHHQLHRG